jgi:WD40 repeat protein
VGAAPVHPVDSQALVARLQPIDLLDAGRVDHLAWAPDGHLLATAGEHTLDLWDPATGRLHHSFYVRRPGSLAWAPDSALLAAGSDHNQIALFDPGTSTRPPQEHPMLAGTPPDYRNGPAPGTSWGGNAWTRSLAWDPTGRLLASAAADRAAPGAPEGAVRLWDPVAGAEARRLLVRQGRGGPAGVERVAWSPDGRWLTVLVEDGTLRLLDTTTGQEHATLTADHTWTYGRGTYEFAWAPDGQMLAIARRRDLTLWDPATGRRLRTLPAVLPPLPTAVPTAAPANWSPLPTPLITGLPAFRLTPQPTPTPSETPAIPYDEPFGTLTSLAWAPGGHTLAAADATSIKLWDAATGTKRRTLAGGADRLAWAPDGQILAALVPGGITLWDAAGGQALRTLPGIFPTPVAEQPAPALAWAPDGSALAVAGGHDVTLWRVPPAGWAPAPSPTASPPPPPALSPTPAMRSMCGGWHILPSPHEGAGSALHAVVALAPADAWAAGYTSTHPLTRWRDGWMTVPEEGAAQALLVHWDGQSWEHAPTPPLPGAASSYLLGLAAAAPADVWAVGYYTTTTQAPRTLILHKDAQGWHAVSSPNVGAGPNRLYAVTARAADDAWAVGAVGEDYDLNQPAQTLILHWDGTRWSVVPSPSPGLGANRLYGVAARAADDVWAVGHHNPGYSGWPVPWPVPPFAGASHQLVLHWDGAAWMVVPTRGEPGGDTLAAVASEGGGVWGVGYQAGEGGGRGLFGHWDGARWREEPLPPLPEESSSYLTALAARAPDDRWAAGVQYRYGYSGDSDRPLMLHWDGTGWTFVPSPRLQGARHSLHGAAAAGETAWAVGSYAFGMTRRTLILQYIPAPCVDAAALEAGAPSMSTPAPSPTAAAPAGSASPTARPPAPLACPPAWEIVPGPRGGTLQAVAARAPDDVWAVGRLDQAPANTLVLHWNGVRWRVVPSPNVGRGDNGLHGVVALAADNAWAIGHYTGEDGAAHPLILHWDGCAWQAMPTGGPAGETFAAIAAAGPTDLWIVGSQPAPDGGSMPLALHGDGARWTPVPVARPPGDSGLGALAVVGAADIWAVGTVAVPDPTWGTSARPLILHWDGGAWAQAILPPFAGYGDTLHGIAARGPDDVWAVGFHNTGEGGDPIVLHWDGGAWQQIPHPPGGAHNGTSLDAVTVAPDGRLWAVGNAGGGPWAEAGDGWSWQIGATPWQAPDGQDLFLAPLRGVAAAGATEVWAVGGGDATVIMRYVPGRCPAPGGR